MITFNNNKSQKNVQENVAKTIYFDTYVRPTVRENPKVTAVIPTLNEAANLPFVIPRLPDIVTEVIIVDGRSKDNTIEVARQLRPDVKIVLETTPGKGAALRAGFAAATGDIIVMLDADGSTDPSEIPAFVGALQSGADFVKGSRFLQGGGTDDMEFTRFLGNYGFTLMVRILFGSKYSDLCYGYSAFWRSVVPQLHLEANGFEIETEMNIRAIRANLNITEVPSLEMDRVNGTSNLNALKDGWRVLKTIFREYTDHLKQKYLVNRASKQLTAGLTKDDFTPAVQLLVREAVYLRSQKDLMDAEIYGYAVEALRESTRSLLNMPCNTPREKLQRERLRRVEKNLWDFLENDNVAVNHGAVSLSGD